LSRTTDVPQPGRDHGDDDDRTQARPRAPRRVGAPPPNAREYPRRAGYDDDRGRQPSPPARGEYGARPQGRIDRGDQSFPSRPPAQANGSGGQGGYGAAAGGAPAGGAAAGGAGGGYGGGYGEQTARTPRGRYDDDRTGVIDRSGRGGYDERETVRPGDATRVNGNGRGGYDDRATLRPGDAAGAYANGAADQTGRTRTAASMGSVGSGFGSGSRTGGTGYADDEWADQDDGWQPSGGRGGPGSPDDGGLSPDGSPADAPGGRAARRQAKNAGKKQNWWRRRSKWFRRLVVVGMVMSVLLTAALVGLVYAATKIPLPQNVPTAQSSVVTYGDGTSEIVKIGTVNRTDVKLAQISKDAQHAVLAAEDRNFYSEPGISYKGMLRALWANLRGGEIQQGGSTITQQYAKNAYLTQERTFSRKLREIVLAYKLDKKYSKDQILEFYLNTIYFGRGAYGIEAAAKTYFGVPASRLTAEQGAVIAGLIRSPNVLDPRVSPRAAARRWHEVVSTMVQKNWLDPARGSASAVMPVTKEKEGSSFKAGSAQAAYIRDEVKRELADHGITESQVALGGLKIVTTLDKRTQMSAYLAVTRTTAGAPPDLQTGLVALEPGTGRVKAWYGGSLYGKAADGRARFVDNVTAKAVPPGSSFKPIVLAAALEKGISLRSQYNGSDKVVLDGYPKGVPNDEGESLGYVDLPSATAHSINSVFVALGIDVGPQKVVDMAHRLGIPKNVYINPGTSVSLGPDNVPALDMASVYSTFASGGMAATPHIVEKVLNRDGKVIYSADPGARRVLSPQVTADATYAMQQVVKLGTGTSAQLANGREAAGKTGTTDNNRSAWFCGYTPQLTAAVTMFRGDGSNTAPQLKNILGYRQVYGGTLPAKTWKAFMDSALSGIQPAAFPQPVYLGTKVSASPTPSVAPTTAAPTTAPPSAEATQTPDQQPTQDPGGRGHTRSPGPDPTSQTDVPTQDPQPTISPPTFGNGNGNGNGN
jgi:membrane peptidoglycan carboxypeptidase